MATTYLTRTFGTATNRKKFTLSMWVKLSGRGSGNNNALLVSGASGQNEGTIGFSNDNLYWTEYNSGSASIIGRLGTSRLFRDYNAWYHLVFVWDSANATAGDRMKLYVNGVEETNFVEDINPSLNYDAQLNNNIEHNIGRQTWNSSGLFNGSMSHIHFCDGQAYQASDFGQADANGVWTIKTSPSVTYGTNGFFILKNGNSVTDQSGNSNNWTVGGGTLTNTEDNPSNVFATLNPLAYRLDAGVSLPTYSNGNNTVSYDAGSNKSSMATLCVFSGKWYWEYKVNSTSDTVFGGITRADYDPNDNFAGRSIYYNKSGALSVGTGTGGTANGSYGNSYTTGDIISVAFDCDNGVIWFAKNGTWQNSATQAEIEAGTTTNSATTGITLNQFWSPFLEGADSALSTNFGNGYFGTTAVASAGTNASGNGIFEYDVPTGYTALCTKGLNGE